jgi:S1-C subfamily serine protease
MIAFRALSRVLAPIAVLIAVPVAWLAATVPAPSRDTTTAIPGATLDRAPAGGGAAVVVTSLRSNGAAGAAGLKVGDRIERIDGLPASTTQAVRHDIARAGGRPLDIQVWRAGHIREIRIVRTVGG